MTASKSTKKRIPINVDRNSEVAKWASHQRNATLSIVWLIKNVINQSSPDIDLFDFLAAKSVLDYSNKDSLDSFTSNLKRTVIKESNTSESDSNGSASKEEKPVKKDDRISKQSQKKIENDSINTGGLDYTNNDLLN